MRNSINKVRAKKHDNPGIPSQQAETTALINSGMNMIGALPENILHIILSLLPTKDATRTSILSKKFYSIWSSQPILDFDAKSWKFKRSEGTNKKRFLRYIRTVLQRRAQSQIPIGLEKLRLHYHGEMSDKDSQDIVDEAIDYAVNNNVKQLDLSFNDNAYTMLPHVYSLNSLKVMKLKGLKMTNAIVINSPMMEELNLSSCKMKKYLTITSNNLINVEIKKCKGVKKLQICSTSLVSFSCKWMKPVRSCEIKTGTCKSLRRIELVSVGVTDKDLEGTLGELVMLETLVLEKCNLLQKIHVIGNPSLKTMRLLKCAKLVSVKVIVSSLEEFELEGDIGVGGNGGRECEINLEHCKLVRVVRLRKVQMMSDWVERNVGKFKCLEELELNKCSGLLGFVVFNDSIRRFELNNCPELMEMHIHARNLTWFKYVGNGLHSKFCVDSPKVEVDISISLSANDPVEYVRMRDFLGCFDHSKSLSITINSVKHLIFPIHEREQLLPPLYDLKKVNIISLAPLVGSLVELIDSLLWLSPLVESIVLLTLPNHKNKVIQLENKDDMEDSEDEDDVHIRGVCCHNHRAIKCWRHYVKKVSIKNFTIAEKNALQRYFEREVFGLEFIAFSD